MAAFKEIGQKKNSHVFFIPSSSLLPYSNFLDAPHTIYILCAGNDKVDMKNVLQNIMLMKRPFKLESKLNQGFGMHALSILSLHFLISFFKNKVYLFNYKEELHHLIIPSIPCSFPNIYSHYQTSVWKPHKIIDLIEQSQVKETAKVKSTKTILSRDKACEAFEVQKVKDHFLKKYVLT